MSLDLYAFIAITPSSSNLDELIKVVKAENNRRQQEADTSGDLLPRNLDVSVPLFDHRRKCVHRGQFTLPCIASPEFELVALHPEHFLPGSAPLTICDPDPTVYNSKQYVVAEDRCLRESRDPSSPRLPPFRHDSSTRRGIAQLNVFLVIINAEIKFRRYFRLQAPLVPLPADAQSLMRRTIELVKLLYWNPLPREGTPGENIRAQSLTHRRRNEPRAARPQQSLVDLEIESDTERENEASNTMQVPSSSWTTKWDRERIEWLLNSDPETCQAWGTALMAGYGTSRYPLLYFRPT